MMHLVALTLCLTGFASLAVATRRQQRDLIGRSLPPTTTYTLRIAGTGALSVALAVLVTGGGWSLGLVMFSGHTSLAAGLVYCGFIAYASFIKPAAR